MRLWEESGRKELNRIQNIYSINLTLLQFTFGGEKLSTMMSPAINEKEMKQKMIPLGKSFFIAFQNMSRRQLAQTGQNE